MTPPPAGPDAPLKGTVVLDLSRVLAGPYCAQTLGDLGADVIKIENPKGGDDTRAWAPQVEGESTYYLCANRNKRSVAVDLSTPQGQALIRRLADKADVFIENYRDGTLERYGLDAESLRARNPRLIYCSISGYGRDSPLASRPGYDFMIQAEAGLMSVTGAADGEPMKAALAVSDLFTGMNVTQAILAALIARGRTGRGQVIDMSLFDSQLASMTNYASTYLVSGQEPGRHGNAHPSMVPYQTFATADGSIIVAVGNDRQYVALCEQVLERPDLAHDLRYARNVGRVAERRELVPTLARLFAARPSAHWLERLTAASVPHGYVRTVAQALNSPEARARGMVRTVSHPVLGEVEMLASPLRLSDTPVVAPRCPPSLGQHTLEVLRDVAGLHDDELQPLLERRVIATGP